MDTSCVATITDYLTLTREAVIEFHEQRDAYIRNQIQNKLNRQNRPQIALKSINN